jgi:hypothetical protein
MGWAAVLLLVAEVVLVVVVAAAWRLLRLVLAELAAVRWPTATWLKH